MQRIFILWGLCLLTTAANAAYPSLQPLIEKAEPNSTLLIPPGTYAGPVMLDFPITLDGQNQVIIDGGGEESVIYIDTDGAQVRNLHLTNSGDSHNDLDSCVQVRGNFNIIKDNILDNCLFGVDLQQSNSNIVRRNKISSLDVELGLRGDAVRLWYSKNNKITHNEITDSRDTVVWYSEGNQITHNSATRGRYSLHFMYSRYNLVEHNNYYNNAVGIFLMYSDDVVVRHNSISHAAGVTGMGIGFKESSNVTVAHNKLLYNAVGIYLDVSPYQPDTINQIHHNKIAYNGIAIQFHNDWTGNVLKKNVFQGNLLQVSVHGAFTAKRNVWQGNYWDDYQGFDRDQDGIGDTPYELYAYADRIWMDKPHAQFFKGSPVLEVLDFLERLAPFTEPALVLRDSKPVMQLNTIKDDDVDNKAKLTAKGIEGQ
ncbi:nitrous oxide reductase family maturation protein NosD [Candidatus Venteria ishoeyi]|uniref:Periplasmic copper-binding protein (NosD) n=1 Tax=Candidatus Venteria ishoeyi TaxID=1899563 RepID=A0A1H6FIP0_9GAMM|nr:nitrous oxide reductase family maturation protein NosD [Candidatus Venteria ishoeyi]MDM8547896.1 nitrous oxide reductase family maturation protein NosD [Candidatus Venteria ishoeyi]SEH08986.1 Periplasmic copper-binding protein (NosD) [Candidatus Venteria ishoeyi]